MHATGTLHPDSQPWMEMTVFHPQLNPQIQNLGIQRLTVYLRLKNCVQVLSTLAVQGSTVFAQYLTGCRKLINTY